MNITVVFGILHRFRILSLLTLIKFPYHIIDLQASLLVRAVSMMWDRMTLVLSSFVMIFKQQVNVGRFHIVARAHVQNTKEAAS